MPPLPRSSSFCELLRSLHSQAPVWTKFLVFLLPDCITTRASLKVVARNFLLRWSALEHR